MNSPSSPKAGSTPPSPELLRLRADVEHLERTLAETQLALEHVRKEAHHYRSIADFSLDWEYWLDADGHFFYSSPSCERITGYAAEEFLDNPDLLRDIVHPEDLANWSEHAVDEHGGHNHAASFEYRIVTKQGEVRWIGHNCTPMFGPDGIYQGRRAGCRDITQVKSRDDKLRLLSRAVEQSPLSIVITNAKGDIEFVNPHFTQLTGYEAHEVLGNNPRVLKSGRQPASFYREMWETIASGHEWRGEFCNRKKNGEEYWEQASISPIKSPTGELTHFLAVKEDITERRNALEQMRESEQRYREVVEGTSNIVTRVDEEGRYTFLNAAARALFGEGTELGSFAFDNLHHEDREPTRRAYAAWLKNRPAHVEYDNRVVDAHGAAHSIHWYISFRFAPDGTLVSAASIGQDISEQHKLQHLREDVDRITRHDLKSPLLGIISVPQLLLADTNLTPEQRELIQAIEDSGYRMLRLINLSLDLYKIETGVYRLRPRRVDLRLVLLRVMEETSRPFRHRHVVMVRDNEPDESPYDVFGEELLCHSLFGNLLRNALDATPDNGTTQIRLLQGDPARIEIHNPLPVPEAVRDTFFEKYSTAEKISGTGLGTYSARMLVEVQDGSIAMRTSESEGTTITVTLTRPPSWAR